MTELLRRAAARTEHEPSDDEGSRGLQPEKSGVSGVSGRDSSKTSPPSSISCEMTTDLGESRGSITSS